MNLRDLVDRWRGEGDLFERRGLVEAAKVARAYADELAMHLTEYELEQLTPIAAAAETGYSVAHVRRLCKGRETIARKDLPRKPGRAA
jgi:hypothetical protein